MDHIRHSRSEKTVEFYHKELAVDLFRLFKEISPSADGQQFFNTIIKPLKRSRTSGDQALAKSQSLPDVGKYEWFIISCAYWIELMRALRENKREEAWSFCMDAYYYCATAKASSNTAKRNVVEIDPLKKARSELGRKAAHAKDLPRANVRAKAICLISERGDKGETWSSYSQMAKDIKEEVMKYAKEQGVSLSLERATATISGYLKRKTSLQNFIRKKSTTLTGRR